MNTVSGYSEVAGAELRKVTAEGDHQNKEKLLISDIYGQKLGYVQDVIDETPTSVTYERSAILEKEKELGIEENTSSEIHRHPNLSIYRSQTDVDNRTKQYIDSNGSKNDFRIAVRDPKLGVNIVVAYDYAGRVVNQRVGDVECGMTMIGEDNVTRPMLLEPSVDELKNVRLAISRYKMSQALKDILVDETVVPIELQKDMYLGGNKVISEYQSDVNLLQKKFQAGSLPEAN